MFLQIATGTGNGAAGTHTGHQGIHLALGVCPDLWAGGAVVGIRVSGIFKLSGDEAAGDLLSQSLRLVHRPLHPLSAGREHQLGPVGGQHGPALGAHGVGHGEDQPVAPAGSYTGQANAGVSGGRLDNGAAGGEKTPLFGVTYHGKGSPVLGAAAGVKKLQLYKQTGSGLGIGLQVEQRGVSNQLLYGMNDLGHRWSPPVILLSLMIPPRLVGCQCDICKGGWKRV